MVKIKLRTWAYIGFNIVAVLDKGVSLPMNEVKTAMENEGRILFLDSKL